MQKSKLGKIYINASTVYKIFLISVIKKSKNRDFIENIKFNIKDMETLDIFLIGKTYRDLIQEIFHAPVMLLNEIIHELHVLFFPTKSAEHKQKWKNDLLEIYTKERSNMSACFFYVLTERLEALTWYCWQESGWFWQWGSNFWQLFLEGILEKNQIFIYNTEVFFFLTS